MKLRYNYRIYPTDHQKGLLAQLFGCVRVVWNDALAWVMQTPEDVQWPSNAELQQLCITLAQDYPERSWLSDVSNIPLQQSIADLGTAFKNFFEKRAKFPAFKKRSHKQSARFRKGGFSLIKNKVYLAKIGNLKVKWSRPLPSEPSSGTVIKDNCDRYHLSFVCEAQPVAPAPVRESVGIDLGLKTFAVLSTGEKISSPGYDRLERKIRRLQRKFSRQVKGSNRWHRTRLVIAKLKARIANIRKDFLHKLSSRVIKENQLVSLEDLNVKGMMQNRRLARAIGLQGWGMFRQMCEAKARMYGRQYQQISRWEPTSQVCSCCGFRWGKLDLSVREVVCLNCGTHHDRDENAAVNIDRSGLELAQDIKWTVNPYKTQQRATGDDLSILSEVA